MLTTGTILEECLSRFEIDTLRIEAHLKPNRKLHASWTSGEAVSFGQFRFNQTTLAAVKAFTNHIGTGLHNSSRDLCIVFQDDLPATTSLVGFHSDSVIPALIQGFGTRGSNFRQSSVQLLWGLGGC